MPRAPGFLHFFESRVGRTVRDHHLVQDGDLLLVASICARDGLSLLDVLGHLRRPVGPTWRLAFVRALPQGWVDAPGWHEAVLRVAAAHGAEVHDVTLPPAPGPGCRACRAHALAHVGRLARAIGAASVAVADTLDTLAEDVLQGLVVHGELTSTAPRVDLDGVVLVRPLAQTEARNLRRYARERDLPSNEAPCPSGQGAEPALSPLLAGLADKPARLKFNLVRAARQGAVVSDPRTL